jgi:hypothetical protein
MLLALDLPWGCELLDHAEHGKSNSNTSKLRLTRVATSTMLALVGRAGARNASSATDGSIPSSGFLFDFCA